jgi:hypothetical protein
MSQKTITLQILGPLPEHGRDAAGNVWSLPRRVPCHNGKNRAAGGHTRAVGLLMRRWPAKGRIYVDGEYWSREEIAGMGTRGEVTLPLPEKP